VLMSTSKPASRKICAPAGARLSLISTFISAPQMVTLLSSYNKTTRLDTYAGSCRGYPQEKGSNTCCDVLSSVKRGNIQGIRQENKKNRYEPSIMMYKIPSSLCGQFWSYHIKPIDQSKQRRYIAIEIIRICNRNTSRSKHD
jgi:hypothetical protein